MDSDIMKQLRDESELLVRFMSVTYNIKLPRNQQGVILFPFEKRWLRGEEYGLLCRHYYAYTNILKMFEISPEETTHPDKIYSEPYTG